MQVSGYWILAGAVVLFLVVNTVGAVATGFTFSGADRCVPVGSTGTYSAALTEVPQGLSGLNVTYTVSDPAIAQITNITASGWAAMPVHSPLPSGQVWFKAVDLGQQVNKNDRNVPVNTITIRAFSSGTVILTVIPVRVEDDEGGRYNPTSQNVSLCIGTGAPTSASIVSYVPAQQNSAQSPSYSITPDVTGTSTSPVATLQTLEPRPSPAGSEPQTQITVSEQGTKRPGDVAPATPSSSQSLSPAPTPAPLSLILPLISLIITATVFGLLKKTRKERL